MQKEHVRGNEAAAVPVHMESRSQQFFGMSRAPLEGALRDIVTSWHFDYEVELRIWNFWVTLYGRELGFGKLHSVYSALMIN